MANQVKKLFEITTITTSGQLPANILSNIYDNTDKGEMVALLLSSNNPKKIVDIEHNLIRFGEVITLGTARYPNLKYHKGKYLSSNNKIISLKKDVDVVFKYLVHFIKMTDESYYIKQGTYPSFSLDIFKKTEITIPPLKEQERIVKILDKLTELTEELTEELTASIKQYEYYRNHMFKLSNNANLIKLKDLIKNAKTSKIQKNFYKSWGEVAIIDQSKNFIAGYTDNIKCITKESIVFGDHTCSIKFINFPFVQGADGIKILQTKDNLVSLKYIYYSMCNFIKYDGKYRRHWSDISNIPIPIPSIKEQERIVKILDKFEYLTLNLKNGLPGEIKLRNKQYEYYRNKLLSFEGDE